VFGFANFQAPMDTITKLNTPPSTCEGQPMADRTAHATRYLLDAT